MARYFWRKEKEEMKRAKKKSGIRETIESILIAVVLALVLRASVVQGYHVPTGSMENTILQGDVFLGNKFLYGIRIPMTDIRLPAIRDPKPGDIVIFQSLEEPSKNFVKRCVAVGGQTVEIRDKALYVDGKRSPLPETGKFEDRRILRGTRSLRDNYGPVTVPPEHFFMMGDNRDNSYDSRYWGPVPKKNILAKATILYFSWDKEVPLWDIAHKIRWGRIAHIL